MKNRNRNRNRNNNNSKGGGKSQSNNGNKPRRPFNSVAESPGCTDKELEHCSHNNCGEKQMDGHQKTADFLSNCVRNNHKWGHDVAWALEEEREFDHNALLPGDLHDTAATAQTKLQDCKIKELSNRMSDCEANMKKAHTLLWGRCTRGFQEDMMAHESWVQVNEHPIRLL